MNFKIVNFFTATLFLAILGSINTDATAQTDFREPVYVNVRQTLDSLLNKEDTDGDKRITIDDPHVAQTDRGEARFWITTMDGNRYEVAGKYYLSNLLQELKLSEEKGDEIATIDAARVFQEPADRISRLIREIYWDGLTRSIDEKGLIKVLSDEKTATVDGFNYLYVPNSDRIAYEYFSEVAKSYPESKIRVIRLPEKITAEYVKNLVPENSTGEGYHGILTLAIRESKSGDYEGVPFVVPGGRFNEMYGWDSYFIVLGLLEDGRIELAKSVVDNFIYEIKHYGKVLNANRTYYLTRSQPPFLTSMALAVYEYLPKNSTEAKNWLAEALKAAVKEYSEVWMSKERLTKTGLSRYYDSGFGEPPEVEPGHFDPIYSHYARQYEMDSQEFELAYKSGKIRIPELDDYFIHDRCMRESGHDTSYRLEGRCANLVTVDLNSLLYKVEMDIAQAIEREFNGKLALENGEETESSDWYTRAAIRRDLINQYLWDLEKGMFFDYDFVHDERINYVSATTFYPLWSGLASREQADLLVKNALPLLESSGGLLSSTEESRGPITPEHPQRQWDYPFGWAPHQMLIWVGLKNYGYNEIANRLIYKWLYTITICAVNYNGTITEKYDVVSRSHQVFAEYGNVGTKFAYITHEGFGWTNSSYQVGLKMLPENLRESLNRLIPPEWLF